MNKKQLFVCLLLALTFTSCKKAMNSEEINNQLSSGVVLILNFYYYSVTLPDGDELFFTGVDDEGKLQNLTYNEDEAKQNRSGCWGTGFFIGNDGSIMTNRHVAQPKVSSQIVKSFLKGFKCMMKDFYREKMKELEQEFYNYSGNDNVQSRIAREFKRYSETLESVDDMDMNDAEFESHCSIGIAYNNTHIISYDDFLPCSIVAVSDDEDVDLAIIQLDDEETPEGKHVFSLRESDEPLTLDEKLFMIGFNSGYSIGKTEQGIRAQVYTGNVTQKDDGVKILYNIPSLHGSSGSPVVDEHGLLVAVNFAGYDTTQGFNYGIPLKRVRQFLQDY